MLRGTRALIDCLVRNPRLSSRTLTGSAWQMRAFRFSNNSLPVPPAVPPGPNASDNPLDQYFDSHHEGPGIFKWRHYFDAYHRHLWRFVGREVRVMEIGIWSGGSLGMWRSYFGPGCSIYGVDVQEACKSYENDHTRVLVGNQGDRAFWRRVREMIPQVDVVIDDGSHVPEHQIVTLEEMFPHIRPGGVFLCEDIHGSDNRFAAYVNGLSQSLHAFEHMEIGAPGEEEHIRCRPTSWQRTVNSITVYPFMSVIEKRAFAPERLSCVRHGSSWQPFFPVVTD